jgi:hypothetical protein
MRIHTLSLGLAIETHIYSEKKMVTNHQPEEEQIKSSKNIHFITFPRFSISSRRNFSASAASEALDRATSTFAVTVFSSC